LDSARPELPGPLASILGNMVAKDPAERYRDLARLMDDLAPFAQEARLPDLIQSCLVPDCAAGTPGK
jgi:hypothetical protein